MVLSGLWGSNVSGRLGDGTTINRPNPVKLNLSGIIAIGAGNNNGIALKQDGTVWVWGDNTYGQLGNGTRDSSITPIQLPGLINVRQIFAGEAHNLALKIDGTLWAWGRNVYGQVGDGTKEDKLVPVQVKGLTGITAFAAGTRHSLAVKKDGTVWGWGDNNWGQLGNIAAEGSTVPVQISGLTGIAAVGAARFFSMAIQVPDTPSTTGCSPAPGARNVPLNATISWLPVPFYNHDFQLSKDEDFNTLIAGVENSNKNTFSSSAAFEPATTYYWRVRSRAITLNSEWVVGSFTTVGATTAPATSAAITTGTPTRPSGGGVSVGMVVVIAIATLVLGVIATTAIFIAREKKRPGR